MAENNEEIQENETADEPETFKSLGVDDVLCEACEQQNWKMPTAIQKEAIPVALKGRDIIGLAETGSGKTGAFAIPILQALRKNPQGFFALVLVPTRELADQLSDQFSKLGATIGVKTALIIGGLDYMTQCISLSKKPHIIIATPGRLVEHLQNMKGFNLRSLKYLVLDEADRMLDMDFELEINQILRAIPKERCTYLYSATMTQKVQKLKKASLRDPVKVEVCKKYQTVEKLIQFVLPIPNFQDKDIYLVHILSQFLGKSVIIFCATCASTLRVALMLRNLEFSAIPIHGKLNQVKRLGALAKFKDQSRSILIATDVASRGLDIPHVDIVINFDLPSHSKDYIHRVGRTARAGRTGKSITFLTKSDLYQYSVIEKTVIGKVVPVYPVERDVVMKMVEQVAEAQRAAKKEMKNLESSKRKGKRQKDKDADNDDTEEFSGVRNRLKKKHKTK